MLNIIAFFVEGFEFHEGTVLSGDSGGFFFDGFNNETIWIENKEWWFDCFLFNGLVYSKGFIEAEVLVFFSYIFMINSSRELNFLIGRASYCDDKIVFQTEEFEALLKEFNLPTHILRIFNRNEIIHVCSNQGR